VAKASNLKNTGMSTDSVQQNRIEHFVAEYKRILTTALKVASIQHNAHTEKKKRGAVSIEVKN
jgi:dsDNA-binding SOS-regulon protein